MALSIQQNAIESQLQSAERRATIRCPNYDPNNDAWKVVDKLLKNQEKVLADILSLTSQMMKKSPESDEAESILNEMTQSLSYESPEKKQKIESPLPKNHEKSQETEEPEVNEMV